ncbi:hypothetical protein IFO69_10485 [Echinicola sp. CAU 1574]|uniref:Uncharacterized protein n=1 Tax=Echinicola arenosa TaxID=2774144 RepID=A0ABR9AK88_9BACT|nr:hypothetical protein [Echinicola arenosa]MBD8489172.1 hypothetical protein [Echinicola arenosa]
MDQLTIPEISETVVSFLLAVITYLLKLLVHEIKQMKRDQLELRDMFIWLKAEQQNIREWLDSQIKEIKTDE